MYVDQVRTCTLTKDNFVLYVVLILACERELRALNMSKKTKQVKVMVVSRAVIWPSSIMSQNTHSVPQMMIDADSSTFRIRLRFKICRDATHKNIG